MNEVIITGEEGMIYSFNGQPFKLNGKITLAVHPLFKAHPGKMDTDTLNYLLEFNRFLRGHKGTLITLEEFRNVGSTASHYFSNNKQTDAFFVETYMANSEPLMKWENFLPILDKVRGGQSIDLIGGYLDIYGGSKFGGCLGGTANRLKEKGIPFNFLEGLTFDSN